MYYRISSLLIATTFIYAHTTCAELFSENFDGDVTSQWKIIPSSSTGTSDFTAIFNFDYSTIGIPEAPNSVGNTDATRGLKMYANEFSNVFGGGSVSPIELDLGPGDYVMTFDWWTNFHGPAPAGGSGTTQLSYAGLLTDGVSPNVPSNNSSFVDGIFLGQTLDGGSSVDWRVYSSIAPLSHQVGETTGSGGCVYAAAGIGCSNISARNASNPYYADSLAFQRAMIPAEQTSIVAGINPLVDHTGSAGLGISAFSWAQGKITKTESIVTFEVNDLLIATIDISDPQFISNPTGGNNILLGHSDTNASISSDPLFSTLTFSLFDNIVVVPEPASFAYFTFSGLMMYRRRVA